MKQKIKLRPMSEAPEYNREFAIVSVGGNWFITIRKQDSEWSDFYNDLYAPDKGWLYLDDLDFEVEGE